MRDLTKILLLTTALTFSGADMVHAQNAADTTQTDTQAKLIERYRITALEINKDQKGNFNFNITGISIPDDDGDATGTNLRTEIHLALRDVSMTKGDLIELGSRGGIKNADPRVQLVKCNFKDAGYSARADVKMIINTADKSSIRDIFFVNAAKMAQTSPFGVPEIILEANDANVIVNGDALGNLRSIAWQAVGNTKPIGKDSYGQRSYAIDFSNSWRRVLPEDGLKRDRSQTIEVMSPR